ncbi:MAG: sensor histidine kinase [Alphaproteobacteria bacterium]|nr:sensor histidine kinase [Alphaproteobacteria bacterium]
MPFVKLPRLDSLQFRLIAGAGIWTFAGLIAGGILLSSIFRSAVERSFDAQLIADMDILITAVDPQPGGTLILTRPLADPRYANLFSGSYWQISLVPGNASARAEVVLRSGSLWDKALDLPPGEPEAGERVGVVGGPEHQDLRFIERKIAFPQLSAAQSDRGPQTFLFVVAGDRRTIEDEISAFNTTLASSLAVLGLGLLIAVLIQVQVGLNPLRRVGEALAAIRSGRAQRLVGKFPAEIAPLAGEINALLAHNAEVLARARTHVGNLAHSLKTPLTVLSNEAQLHKGALADTVKKQTIAMRRQVDHYLARARAAATADVLGARTEIAPVVQDIARTLEKIHDRRGIEITVDMPEALAFRGERQDLEELIGNLLENACKWARTEVALEARSLGRQRLEIAVSDDGPGISSAERARVLERGERLDETVPGSGLGLGIVRDIARLYGGDIALDASARLGGLKAVLILPQAEN